MSQVPTVEQAYQFLSQVLPQLKLTVAEHQLTHQSLQVLVQAARQSSDNGAQEKAVTAKDTQEKAE